MPAWPGLRKDGLVRTWSQGTGVAVPTGRAAPRSPGHACVHRLVRCLEDSSVAHVGGVRSKSGLVR